MGRTYETLQVSISAWESVDLFILEAHDGWSGIAGLVPVTHARERPWTSSADGMNNETYPDEEAAEVFAPAVLTFFSFVCPSVYHFGHSARACRSRHSRTAVIIVSHRMTILFSERSEEHAPRRGSRPTTSCPALPVPHPSDQHPRTPR